MEYIDKSKNSSFSNEDIIKNIYDKSGYLKNLIHKKKESFEKVALQKFEILKDKLFRRNHFQRNYSIFYKKNINMRTNQDFRKFYFSPETKPIILSPDEINYPNRYRKKEYDIDNFALIYKKRDNYINTNLNKVFLKPSILEKTLYRKIEINKANCCVDLEDKNYCSKSSTVYSHLNKQSNYSKNPTYSSFLPTIKK